MKHPDYNSPTELKNILDSNGFSMQKKFGQNFLVNENARQKLIDSLDIQKDTTVWEVGPGLGAMTSIILSRGAKLTAFEIDRGFASLIKTYFSDEAEEGRFSVVEGDVLKTWFGQTQNGQELPQRFFGNLPYNIAATIIADTIEKNIRFDKCVFTVQKEVAQRMCAKPGSEQYSSLSVLCNWAYDVKPLMDLSSANFWPKPNVDSRAVLFVKKTEYPLCTDSAFFVKLERGLFSSRRKTVRNNLQGFLKDSQAVEECLSQAQINPMLRAEVLTIEQMLKLSDTICEYKKQRQAL